MFEKIIERGLYGLICQSLSLDADSFYYWALMILAVLLCMAAGYLIGSLNAAIIISRSKFGSDIRTHGSGNAGMTNMFRTFGKKAGLLTLVGDLLKTAVPVMLGYLFLGYDGSYLAGLFVVLGHCFPIYYKFKGGKGVLAAAVMMLLCDPLVFLLLILVFAIMLIGTRFVSMSSVMAALMLPLFLRAVYAWAYGDGATAGIRIPIVMVITLIIVFMHRANLKRIYKREEPRVKMPWDKKKTDD